jgi:phosphate starvation-inducible PhoH-like protein
MKNKEIKLRSPVGKTENQKKYIKAILDNDLVVCDGVFGTGKTNLAVGVGIYSLMQGQYNKLVVTRPVIEAGETIGYLPGDLNEKLAPYIKPIFDELSYYIEVRDIALLRNEEKIEICPIGFMRGRTFRDSYIIVDEAQNLTYEQMKMVITRIGVNSKMVLTGDISQSDLYPRDQGAFAYLKKLIKQNKIEKTAVVELGYMDIQRHPLVTRLISRWEPNNQD